MRAEVDAQRTELAARLSLPQRILTRLDPHIRTGDVQVRFEASGEVVVAGYVEAWKVKLAGIFVVAPRASDGELSLDFVSGQLGRLPLPEVAFDVLGRAMASAILLGRDRAEVSEISVGDGTLTFEGRLGAWAHGLAVTTEGTIAREARTRDPFDRRRSSGNRGWICVVRPSCVWRMGASSAGSRDVRRTRLHRGQRPDRLSCRPSRSPRASRTS